MAKRTGRTKTFSAREAILEHLEDLEDIDLATRRLQRPTTVYPAAEAKNELGLSIRPRGLERAQKVW